MSGSALHLARRTATDARTPRPQCPVPEATQHAHQRLSRKSRTTCTRESRVSDLRGIVLKINCSCSKVTDSSSRLPRQLTGNGGANATVGRQHRLPSRHLGWLARAMWTRSVRFRTGLARGRSSDGDSRRTANARQSRDCRVTNAAINSNLEGEKAHECDDET